MSQVRYRTFFGTADGTRTTIYTCPSNCRSIIRTISGEVAAGTGVKATVEIYSTTDADRYFILNDRDLPFVFDEHPIVLEAGDRVEVTASSGTSPEVDAMVSAEEIFIPVGG